MYTITNTTIVLFKCTLLLTLHCMCVQLFFQKKRLVVFVNLRTFGTAFLSVVLIFFLERWKMKKMIYLPIESIIEYSRIQVLIPRILPLFTECQNFFWRGAAALIIFKPRTENDARYFSTQWSKKYTVRNLTIVPYHHLDNNISNTCIDTIKNDRCLNPK